MEELKDSIINLIEDKKIDELKKMINEADMLLLLNVFQELDSAQSVIVFRLLSKERSLDLFELLETSSQEELFQSFTEERAHEIIEWLEPDDRVRLLDELPAAVAKRMLIKLSAADRAQTNLLMGYESGTAGRIMTPDFISVKRNKTAASAMEKVKKLANEIESIHTIYVINEKRSFEGVLSLRELLVADPNQTIEEIMRTDIISVTTCTDQEEVARTLQRLGLMAIPVVDKENQLVGIITVDDAMDILEQEATEDILDNAGMMDLSKGEQNRGELLVKGPLWKAWTIRLPFLVLTMLGGLVAGMVVGLYEEVLAAAVMVAFFSPVVMTMGGNVGVQSSAIFMRGLLLGYVQEKRILKHILREMMVGLSMGIIVGGVCGLIILFWQGLSLALAVGCAIAVTMTVASLFGFLIPYVLYKLKIDQAAASSPIIACINDVSGLFIYFSLVILFL